MAKKLKGKAGLKLTSRVAMNRLKKSQLIAIFMLIIVFGVGAGIVAICYYYPNVTVETDNTTEQGKGFSVNSIMGSAPVDISIKTDAREPPKFFVITENNFKRISPGLVVPNENQDPLAVKQLEQASFYYQYNKKDFRYEGDLDNDEWYVIVVTNQTEGGVGFNMIYNIQVFNFRPLVLPVSIGVIIAGIGCFVYVLHVNTRLKKVQEKVSTQRLLKAQMDMVRNFILQSSGTSQPFSFSSSPYKQVAGESIPRDAVPLAVAQGDVEIVECYACNELITVNSRDRPLIVACPNCGVKSQVTESEEEEEGAPAAKPKETLPPAQQEVKALPAGNPPEAEGQPTPTPTPAPTPAPSPAPTPKPASDQK